MSEMSARLFTGCGNEAAPSEARRKAKPERVSSYAGFSETIVGGEVVFPGVIYRLLGRDPAPVYGGRECRCKPSKG